MNRVLIISVLLIIVCTLSADLTETKKIQVSFEKFGTYSSQTTENYHHLTKRVANNSNLVGKGFFGKLLAGFFPKGNNADIFDLNTKLIHNLDLDNSTYTTSPIQQYFSDDEEEEIDEGENEEEEIDETEREYRVIREEFRVIDTKEKVDMNQFKTHRYNIIYLVEQEHIETKEIRTDSLFVDVYTTRDKAIFEKANQEKKEFNLAMMEAIGLEVDEQAYEDLLGLSWINMLSSLDNESSDNELEIDMDELKKIKGHPVLTDGSYYSRKMVPVEKKKKKKKSKFGLSSLTKMQENITKAATDSIVNKKTDESVYKKQLNWKSETISIDFNKVNSDQFTVPDDFSKMN